MLNVLTRTITQNASFLRISYNLLASSAFMLRPLHAGGINEAADTWLSHISFRLGRHDLVEKHILRSANQAPPSLATITQYISKLVNPGFARRAGEIAAASSMPNDLRVLLEAAIARADGDPDQALEILDGFRSTDPAVRKCFAEARKSIFHEKGDHASIARSGIRFLQEEPEVIHLPFTISIAASAEGAELEDIFAAAVRRALDDIRRVEQDPQLLKAHWADAVEAAVTLFDFETAFRILSSVTDEDRLEAARRRHEKITAIFNDLQPIAAAVEQARCDFHRRAHGMQRDFGDAAALIVIPSAAVRSNRIDYPGFRRDLRRIVVEIGTALEARHIRYVGLGRIRTHGRVRFDRPFFSYHTYSDAPNGVHFKEADRPHCFTFDRRGYAGWSEFSRATLDELDVAGIDPAVARSFREQELHDVVLSKTTKYKQSSHRDSLPSTYVLVALQLVGDAVQANAYMHAVQMLDTVIAACRESGIAVVVKRHPLCRSAGISRYLEAKAGDPAVTIARGNIHDLIAGSIAVCTQNSGVGAEALVYGKPVATFGRADYSAGTTAVRSLEDFQGFIDRLSSRDERSADGFYFVYRNRYVLDIRKIENAGGVALARSSLDGQ